MASFLVHAHGMIQGGSGKAAVPKFIVPEHTTIYFFCHHGSSMISGSATKLLADLMLKMLLGPGWTMENERAVREDACEVLRAGDLCPNYYTETRSELDFPSSGLPNGVYQVGGGAQPARARPLPIGHTVTLQQIVGGVSSGGSMGNHFYWNCCREVIGAGPRAPQRKYLAGFGGIYGAHVSKITGHKTSTSTLPVTMLTDSNYKSRLEALMRHVRATGTMFKDS